MLRILTSKMMLFGNSLCLKLKHIFFIFLLAATITLIYEVYIVVN